MKLRKIILIFIFASMVFSVFGQENLANESKDVTLVEDSPIETRDVIGPFCLNLFLGYGIGDFVLGNVRGGVIQAVGEGASFICAGVGMWFTLRGFYYLNLDIIDGLIGGESGDVLSDKADKLILAGKIIVNASCFALLAFRVMGFVSPWVYAKRHNEKLAASLGVDEVSFSVAPVFDLKTSTPQLALVGKVRF